MRGFWLIAGLCLALSARADWVTARGEAPIIDGDVNQARAAAHKAALGQAALLFEAHVTSYDELRDGELIRSTLEVTSQARARRVVVEREEVLPDRVRMIVRADMVAAPACDGRAVNTYRKRVVLMGTAVAHPDRAGWGGLTGIGRGLPARLQRSLLRAPGVEVLQASHLGIYQDWNNAPAHETDQRTLTQAVDISRELGAQFVVSTVVRDASLTSPETFGSSVVKTAWRLTPWADRSRRFVLDVFVHDGFSGALIYRNEYTTSGEWTLDPALPVVFASDRFLSQPYGEQVERLLERAADDLADTLRCQPFMTRIKQVEDLRLLLDSGANAGIRPGDQFRVYRSRLIYDGTRLKGTELRDVSLAVKVVQVQPDFAIATFPRNPSRLNIQRDDVLIAW
ncbi:flagellar assembly protein T N-terminal domain-containing protein [Hahella sp. SMD15-11]|uniref:Flagellar assembly protein T N-terminal domain-containing protein n=1 Tax=Thermohahella caldifontis TaxID=3142973 RepID=A0AB39UVY2_9GAMM